MEKLKESEVSELISILKGYRDVHDKIKLIDESIKELFKEQEVLLPELEKFRESEKNLLSTLNEKYGSGYLDVKNLSWVYERDHTENI